jgi:hypothetical protein
LTCKADSGIVAADTVLDITSEKPLPRAATAAAAEGSTKTEVGPHEAMEEGKSKSVTETGKGKKEVGIADKDDDEDRSFMFPYIQGVLAFDTPYLGISPGVIAHGAEGHYNTASTAFTQLSSIFGGSGSASGGGGSRFWGGKTTSAPARRTGERGGGGAGGGATQGTGDAASNNAAPLLLLPPRASDAPGQMMMSGAAGKGDATAAAGASVLQRWGKVAMYAGAAGAVVASGATAAYLKREQLTAGWTWVGSHLEFVGCLVRPEELRRRLHRLIELEQQRGLGFVDVYAVLGAGAARAAVSSPKKTITPSSLVTAALLGSGAGAGAGNASGLAAGERTFCGLPPTTHASRKYFVPQVNDAATDETWAHMSEFYPHPITYKPARSLAVVSLSHATMRTHTLYTSHQPPTPPHPFLCCFYLNMLPISLNRLEPKKSLF